MSAHVRGVVLMVSRLLSSSAKTVTSVSKTDVPILLFSFSLLLLLLRLVLLEFLVEVLVVLRVLLVFEVELERLFAEELLDMPRLELLEELLEEMTISVLKKVPRASERRETVVRFTL